MKMILAASLMLLASPAFAISNLELAGNCKPTVEKTISGILKTQTQIIATEDQGDGSVVVTFDSFPQKAVLNKAVLKLENVQSLARGRMVYVINCSISALTFTR